MARAAVAPPIHAIWMMIKIVDATDARQNVAMLAEDAKKTVVKSVLMMTRMMESVTYVTRERENAWRLKKILKVVQELLVIQKMIRTADAMRKERVTIAVMPVKDAKENLAVKSVTGMKRWIMMFAICVMIVGVTV